MTSEVGAGASPRGEIPTGDVMEILDALSVAPDEARAGAAEAVPDPIAPGTLEGRRRDF